MDDFAHLFFCQIRRQRTAWMKQVPETGHDAGCIKVFKQDFVLAGIRIVFLQKRLYRSLHQLHIAVEIRAELARDGRSIGIDIVIERIGKETDVLAFVDITQIKQQVLSPIHIEVKCQS